MARIAADRVSRATPVPIRSVWKAARDAIENPSDRLVLIALFTSLFCLHYLVRLFVPDPAPFAAPFPTAELVGFAAIASVLWSLGADRVLHPWDYPVIMIAA